MIYYDEEEENSIDWFKYSPVVSVVPDDENYTLLLTFADGKCGIYDVKPYLDWGVFKALNDKKVFNTARVWFDTVCWDGELDIAPETLYHKCVPIN
jgi:hypothetical protein